LPKPRVPRATPSPPLSGPQLTLWTRDARGGGGALAWSSRFTDEEGMALFFVAPRSAEFWVNFTLGTTLLASRRVDPVQWQGDLPGAEGLQPPAQPVDTERCAARGVGGPGRRCCLPNKARCAVCPASGGVRAGAHGSGPP
jgi:hypothetical protein